MSREKIISRIVKIFDIIDKSGKNSKDIKTKLEKLSDKDFHRYMEAIRDKKEQITLYMPNLKNDIRLKDAIEAAKAVGITLFDTLILTDPVTKKTYVTNHKYLILNLPIRRVKQIVIEKRSVPESDRKVDLLSGQVIKPDQSSTISLLETQILAAKGLDRSIMELIKVRGGDINAYATFKSHLEEKGSVSLSEIDPNTSVKSAITTSVYLKAMHIDNNLQE
jgi:hypothetical protein